MSKRALITGCNGQDGSYLAELLIDEGYIVHGMVRRQSVAESQTARIWMFDDHNKFHTYYGDITDANSCHRIVREARPDEVYNLAAQSHVRVSFDKPSYTAQVNALGALNMLEAVRCNAPAARYYQASSSEMFGNSCPAGGANEKTPMDPVSPYGVAKLFAFNMTKHFRESYRMFAVNGILFNHSSPRRGRNFAEAKIVDGALRRAFQAGPKITLGNIRAMRDWGHAREYVRAMWLMTSQMDDPTDYVIGTGKTVSVEHILDKVCEWLGWRVHDVAECNRGKFLRPSELHYLKADARKAETMLGWTDPTTIDDILMEMLTVRAEELKVAGQLRKALTRTGSLHARTTQDQRSCDK